MPKESHMHGAYDHALEHVAESGHADSFTRRITVMTAILSAAGAIFGYQGGATRNAALLARNEAAIHKTEAVNRWAYYQAKGQRQTTAELAVQLPDTDRVAARREARRYVAEKEDIRHQAEDQERLVKEADDASELTMYHHHRWAQAVVAIQVSIVPAAITLFSRRRWMQVFSYGVTAVGGAVAALALLHI